MIKHYVDDIPPASGRKYNIDTNSQGQSTITDVTDYVQEGSSFGATDICNIGIIEVTHSKTGTVHSLITDNVAATNIKFKVVSTMPYIEGDTFLFNNTVYTGKTLRGENLPGGCFAGDAWVFGVLDHINHIIYINVANTPRSITVSCMDGEYIDDGHYCYKVDVSVPGITENYKAFTELLLTTQGFITTMTETKTDMITVYFTMKPYPNTYMTISFFKVYE